MQPDPSNFTSCTQPSPAGTCLSYRVQLHKHGRDVAIYSRNGYGFTDRCATVAMLLRELPAKTALLDGEIVAKN